MERDFFEQTRSARVHTPPLVEGRISMTRTQIGLTPSRLELSRHLNRQRAEFSDDDDGAEGDSGLLQFPRNSDALSLGYEFVPESTNDQDKKKGQEEDETKQGQNDNQDSGIDSPLGIYFRDIARIPLLTAEQEVDLAQKLEAGRIAKLRLMEDPPTDPNELESLVQSAEIGDGARKTLMESNLRLVVSVARRYLGRGLPFPDMIQEGSIGLARAVEKFDYRRGFKFSTYAYWWIRQAVTREIANQSRTIRVPVHMIDQIGHVYSKYQELQQKLGHDPKIEELAAAMDMTVEKVREVFRASANPISLETPVGSDEENTLGDLLSNQNDEAPADAVERTHLADQLDDALGAALTPREADVLRLRFGLRDRVPKTLGEIGKELGISRERVRQIEAEAIAKMRRPNLRLRLQEYLE